eukprot:132162_1
MPFATNSIFNVFDLIVGLLIIVAAFVSFQGTFVGIIIPVYIILFGTLIIIMVFYIPPTLHAMIPFYMNFLGRGLTFLFLGCLVLVGPGNTDVKTAVAVIALLVAFAYIILWILFKFAVIPCGSLPPPFLQSDNAQSSSNNNAGSSANKNSDDDDDKEVAAPTQYDDNQDTVDVDTR